MNQEARHHKALRLSYIGIEEAERIVTARVNGEADLGELILGSRCGLGATKRTLEVGVADIELIVVGRIGFQFAGFDLYKIPRSENWMSGARVRKAFKVYVLYVSYIPLKYNLCPSSCTSCPSRLLLPKPCLPLFSTEHRQEKLMVEGVSRSRDRKWGQD